MTAEDDDLPTAAANSKHFAKAFIEISPKLTAELQHLRKRLEREGRWQYVGDVRNPEGYVLSEFDGHGQQLRKEQDAVLAKIDELLTAKLQRRLLSAWAREGSPLGLWRTIPPSAWQTLTIKDFRAGTFNAPGITLFDMRIGLPVLEDALTPAPAPRRSETGAPGRPSSMHLVVLKLRERAKAGRLETTVKGEAAALAAWFKANHPDKAPPTAKTIENNIRAEYRHLRARKSNPPKL